MDDLDEVKVMPRTLETSVFWNKNGEISIVQKDDGGEDNIVVLSAKNALVVAGWLEDKAIQILDVEEGSE